MLLTQSSLQDPFWWIQKNPQLSAGRSRGQENYHAWRHQCVLAAVCPDWFHAHIAVLCHPPHSLCDTQRERPGCTGKAGNTEIKAVSAILTWPISTRIMRESLSQDRSLPFPQGTCLSAQNRWCSMYRTVVYFFSWLFNVRAAPRRKHQLPHRLFLGCFQRRVYFPTTPVKGGGITPLYG